MDKEALFAKIKEIMADTFSLDPESINPEKRLDDDYGLDSLDMVDLVIAINDQADLLTGEIEPALFKDARTVQNVIDILLPFFK